MKINKKILIISLLVIATIALILVIIALALRQDTTPETETASQVTTSTQSINEQDSDSTTATPDLQPPTNYSEEITDPLELLIVNTPYRTEHFDVELMPNNQTSFVVTIYSQTGNAQEFASYKNEALAWIQGFRADPASFNLIYIVAEDSYDIEDALPLPQTASEKLASQTPFYANHFSITHNPQNNSFEITLYGIYNHEWQREQYLKDLASYKEEALLWIESQDVDPSQITIQYIPEEAKDL